MKKLIALDSSSDDDTPLYMKIQASIKLHEMEEKRQEAQKKKKEDKKRLKREKKRKMRVDKINQLKDEKLREYKKKD